MKGFRYLLGFGMIVFGLGGMVAPAAGQTDSASPRSPSLQAENLFGRAEYQFHAGNFLQAKPLYQKFLEGSPPASKAEQAFLRLGQIDQATGSYVTALHFYRLFQQNYPESFRMPEVRFQMAECYFELGNYREAQTLFQDLLETQPGLRRRGEAILYLSRIDRIRQDFETALLRLRQIYQGFPESEIRQQAVRLAETIIDDQLPREDLYDLVRRHPAVFPLDLMMLKLISLFREERDLKNFRSFSLEFIRLFPQHPRTPQVERFLRSLKPEGQERIRLGAVLPLTGKMALTGQHVLQGIQLALNEEEMKGRGNIQLEVRDSAGGRPVDEIVEDLAGDPNLVGIIGPVLSEEVKTVSPLTEEYKIPVFTPTASAEGLPELSSFIFRNALTRRKQARFLAEYSVNKLNLRRFAILYPLESFGIELKEIFSQAVESLGGQIVVQTPYERSQTDFRRQILELGGVPDDHLARMTREELFQPDDESGPAFGHPGRLSRPVVDLGLWAEGTIEDLKVSLELSYDAIFLPGLYDKVGLIIPQLVFYNIDQVPLLGASGWNSPELVRIAGRYLKSGFFVDGFFVDSDRPPVQKFVRQFQSTFGTLPTLHAAQAYDTTRMMIRAIGEGADNRLKLRDGLMAVENFPGASGTTTVLASGECEKELFTLTVKGRQIVEGN